MKTRWSVFLGVVLCLTCGREAVPSVQVDSNPAVNFHPTLSLQEKQHILDGHCNIVTSTAPMPKRLKDIFAKVTREPQFELANPGEDYQVTDVVMGHRLPSRRLIFAGTCGDRWFIHYELGGIAHMYLILIFRPDPKGLLQFTWGGAGSKRAKNIKDLRLAIASGEFKDGPAYYW